MNDTAAADGPGQHGGVADDQLWQRAAAGDVDCFGELFSRHHHAVRSYCHQRTGSLSDAEDLTSIVFLEAWRRRNEVQLHGTSLLPWFLAVAGRTIRHRWRTTRRHRAALARMPAELTSPDHAEHVAERLDLDTDLAAARRAFTRLSAADQDVLALCVGQALDYAAASIALGVPIGTVRSRLSRARARLRNLTRTAPPGHRDQPGRPPGPFERSGESTGTSSPTSVLLSAPSSSPDTALTALTAPAPARPTAQETR
ncbi:RNA polymerase sigma factor [Kineococcus arenarius]|uniref:RNA polymerase sigma factor n=1 Tax=unclassified Kineococcus TaxID=2621656 RepID=UPI003D7DC912